MLLKYAGQILDNAMMGIFIIDVHAKDKPIVYCNSMAEKITGYSKEELLGKNQQVLQGPGTDLSAIKKFYDAINACRCCTIILKNYRKDGSSFMNEIEASPIFSKPDEIIYFLIVLNDISARYDNEKELAINEERLARAQRIAGVGCWELDLTTNKLFWSDEIFRIFGMDKNKFEASYESFLQSIHPEDREMVNNAYLRSINDKTKYDITHRLLMPDGTIKWVHESCESYYDDTGNPTQSIGTVHDITNIINLEQEKSKSQAKSAFLSSMSHELRTPLNAIIGFAELYRYDKVLTDKQRENADQILNAGNHLLNLVNEILDLSKIEAGKLDILMEPVLVMSVVDECIALSIPLAEKKNISLNKDLGSSQHLYVHADILRLKQVLLNLISNAIKYNRENGTVFIQCKWNDLVVRISVIDTGQGFSKEQLSNLFQPFVRFNDEHNKVTGTGIGLLISKNLVDLMGGELGVVSEEGKGSTFWVELGISAVEAPSV